MLYINKRGKLMKFKSMLSVGLLALVTVSTAYAADKYPLDPAYAANKKAMAAATAYENANISPSTPSSGGEQWKLIYSGSGTSSVNIPSGTNFVSVSYGGTAVPAKEIISMVEKSMSNNRVDTLTYSSSQCGSNSCTTGGWELYLYVDKNRVYIKGSDKFANRYLNNITKVYAL